jgi:hypothetical protein
MEFPYPTMVQMMDFIDPIYLSCSFIWLIVQLLYLFNQKLSVIVVTIVVRFYIFSLDHLDISVYDYILSTQKRWDDPGYYIFKIISRTVECIMSINLLQSAHGFREYIWKITVVMPLWQEM